MINRLPEKFVAEAWTPAGSKSEPFDVNREMQKVFDRVETWVRANPAACLAGAFFIGASVAWWMKRR